MNARNLIVTTLLTIAMPLAASAQSNGASASSCLLEQAMVELAEAQPIGGSGSAEGLSLFHVPSPEARTFREHDLVQIIIRESAKSKSKHKLEAEKDIGASAKFEGSVLDHPIRESDISFLLTKAFEGEGKYERDDDFTARVTAEVIDVLPNGNLVLEGRTTILQDEELKSIAITGICRSVDVTTANTVLSSQIHDLKIENHHEGELKRANERGILAKIFDFIFAW